jgi:hypothetical protein
MHVGYEVVENLECRVMLKLLESPKACRGVELVTCCVVPKSLSIKSISRGSSQLTPRFRSEFYHHSSSQAIVCSMHVDFDRGSRDVK